MRKRRGVKWYVKDMNLYASMLTKAQIGELFVAVMHYAATGERMPVSDKIICPFDEQCRKIDKVKARAKAWQEARRQDE